VRLLVLLAAVFAAAGLWVAATSPDEHTGGDVHSVAATLRCPTCVAESAADSTAPLAVSMRETVAEHLALGRSPDEIRTWFAQRYGDEVLLDPPRRGAGWLLWLLPFAVAPLAVWVILRWHRRRLLAVATTAAVFLAGVLIWAMSTDDPSSTPPDDADRAGVSVALLEQAAEDAPGDVQVRVALARGLDEQGRLAEATEHYAAALRLRPHDDTLRYRSAFAFVRAGQHDEAIPVLDSLLEDHPDHPEALLLRGTVAAEQHDPRAGEMLRRFIEVAPDHPAADQAQALLDDEPEP
jgi:cytochrome c-type biogenesis protein CcmH/NrfF